MSIICLFNNEDMIRVANVAAIVPLDLRKFCIIREAEDGASSERYKRIYDVPNQVKVVKRIER